MLLLPRSLLVIRGEQYTDHLHGIEAVSAGQMRSVHGWIGAVSQAQHAACRLMNARWAQIVPTHGCLGLLRAPPFQDNKFACP